jgi:hypothetical protein
VAVEVRVQKIDSLQNLPEHSLLGGDVGADVLEEGLQFEAEGNDCGDLVVGRTLLFGFVEHLNAVQQMPVIELLEAGHLPQAGNVDALTRQLEQLRGRHIADLLAPIIDLDGNHVPFFNLPAWHECLVVEVTRRTLNDFAEEDLAVGA